MRNKLFRLFILALFLLPITASLVSSSVSASNPSVSVLQVKGTIVPVVADYIDRGISEAEDNGDSVCIIELDTPGGLLSSTERIVQTIFNAHIPVVVYVSPKGAWAASAGTFITLSAHIAAMTPGTTIGAAHPVSGSGEAIPEDEMKKITEFSAKWIGAIAEDRGRNREEAEKAVTESKSFTDTDALKSNLIDLRADNLDDLLNKINGMSVMVDGQEITIDTTGYGEPVKNNMSEIEHFLLVISDPNIAYLLFTLATIGLITEVSNPGMIFPGVVGGISLLLAFYSLGVLNAYWGGLLLLFLGVGLLVAEFLTPTFGLLTAGGVTSLVIGSLILFSHSPGIAINRGLIAGVAILITAFAVFVIGAIVHSQKRRKATGPEGMLGKIAIAKTPLAPTGTVLAEGELWAAVAEEESIKLGEEVIITKVEQLKLSVTRKNID